MQRCLERVRRMGDFRVEEFRLVEERVMFPLPGELLAGAQAKGVAFAAGNERAAARASAESGAAAAGAGRPAAKESAEFRIRHH